MAGELEKVLVCLVDTAAVASGEQVEHQPTRHGEKQPRLDPGGRLVDPSLHELTGQSGDPALHTGLEEPLEASLTMERVGVELEEQPLERPRLRVGVVLPEQRG